MPRPKKSDTRESFVSRYMSSEESQKKYPEQDQRLAIAYSIWERYHKNKETNAALEDDPENCTSCGMELEDDDSLSCKACKKKVKTSFCDVPILATKEVDGEFYSEGFCATTHPDRAVDPELGVAGDILSMNVLKQIKEYINTKVASIRSIGSTRSVSDQHDWVKQHNPDLPEAGHAVPPCDIRETVNISTGKSDGNFGVYVVTHHNKNHPDFEQIKYNVEHGYYPGYSIEYEPGDYEIVNFQGQKFRLLKSIKNFLGYAFAGARKIANPMAIITSFGYKEIDTGDVEMSDPEEDKQKLEAEQKAKEEAEAKAKAEAEEKAKLEAEQKAKEEAEAKAKAEEEAKLKEAEAKRVEQIAIKELVDKISNSAELKTVLDNLKVKPKVKVSEGTNMEAISIKEMNSLIAKRDPVSIKEIKEIALKQGTRDVFEKALKTADNYTVGFKHDLQVKVSGKGFLLDGAVQIKDSLQTGDNASGYTQEDVEFADVFQPGIIDTFNNQVNFFGFLKKKQHVGGEYVQWKIITNRDPLGTSTFVGKNDIGTTMNKTKKLNLQSPLKIARRGVSVTDFMLRYSARSLGDLFQIELDAQNNEMMKDINAALFAEVADGTNDSPLGLEAVADSAGNTTLYGLTRSTANRLSPDTAANTYYAVGGNLTNVLIRNRISYLETEGTKFGDIAIICSPTVRDYLFTLQDGKKTLPTTEAVFGFDRRQVPVFEGVPVIVDADCNSDAMYLIDTNADFIYVGMAPQLTNLAKIGASTDAYEEFDFAHIYEQPRRISMLDTLSGPTS